MTTLTLSPTGQITLPPEILQRNHWQTNQLVLLSVGDMLILRPACYQKTDDISDLGGFFNKNSQQLSTEQLCQPVNLTEES
jgi:hypothetical protein